MREMEHCGLGFDEVEGSSHHRSCLADMVMRRSFDYGLRPTLKMTYLVAVSYSPKPNAQMKPPHGRSQSAPTFTNENPDWKP